MRKTSLVQKSKRAWLASKFINLAGHLTRPLHHRGFYNLIEPIQKIIPSSTRCQVKLSEDALFEFALNDPYWNRLIHSHFCYEFEIERALTIMKGLRYGFIDGGANWGYWSILASSKQYGAEQTIAYEPMPIAFSFLKRNRDINGNRFEIHNNAIADVGKRNVPMFCRSTGPISAVDASIVTPDATKLSNMQKVSVDCVTLDSVISEFAEDLPLLIKLDLEGTEVTAMNASKLLIERQVLVLYEDHAKDLSCESSRFLLDKGWPIFFISDEGDVERIHSTAEVLARKTRKSRGYNFLAATPHSEFFNRLNRLVTN